MADCGTCKALLQRFTDPTFRDEINLGSWDEALSSLCPSPLPLIKAFHAYCSEKEHFHHDTKDVGIVRGVEGHSVELFPSISKLGAVWALLLAQGADVTDHAGTGRVLDPDWADLGLAKKWKTMCLEGHGANCQNPMRIPRTAPKWLVDVDKRCIVPGEARGPYVALSYRWGGASGYRLNEDVLPILQKDYALDEKNISDHLPPIIQHAMFMTAVLGERYLWVDALCVVHGGHADSANQLNLMSAIYANAVVTIVAADGDASDGLLGLRDVSTPRGLEQKIIPFGNEKLIVRNNYIFSLDTGTEYYERAWTYQEQKMSSRKIFFNRKEIHWECQCSVWHEELTLGTEVDKYIDPRLSIMLAGFPDLESLSHVIGRYNERKLTYDEDALSGISGLLAVLSRSFTGGFLYGCAEMYFDRFMGWVPQWGHTNLRRRIASSRPEHERVTRSSASLPSWSWIGWEGMIWLKYGEATRINDICHSLEETIPITQWYTANAPTVPAKSRRRIRSTWFEYIGKYKDLTQPLPPGWTKEEAPTVGSFRDEPRLYPDECGKYIFKHKDLTGEAWGPTDEFYFPFPVAEITPKTPFFTPEQTPYLFCKTKKATMWAERAEYKVFPREENVLKLRQDAGSAVVGSLHLQTEEQLAQWPEVLEKPGHDTKPDGKMVDLVAIHRSVYYAKTFDEEKKAYGYPFIRNERYAVLWVEWHDNVAYRLACGNVEKDAWESLELEGVDLVLG